jgi:hypothetical protein
MSSKIQPMHHHLISAGPLTLFPTLSGLGLDDAVLDALRQQGFVGTERRGKREIHKLRYRIRGRQCVRYIRASQVAAVTDELNRLQAPVRLRNRLRTTIREARVLVRTTKQDVISRLNELELVFHGTKIRQPRRRSDGDQVDDSVSMLKSL